VFCCMRAPLPAAWCLLFADFVVPDCFLLYIPLLIVTY
jgi:hypothetical protein